MKDEIKVGEYIRTFDGIIDKVIIDYKGKCNNPSCQYKHISCQKNYYDEKNIVKHSSNIIELIKIGDYVNGCYVNTVNYKNKVVSIDVYNEDGYVENIDLTIKDIRTIVTKEMLKSIEYTI